MPFVLDSSVTLTWCFEDESTEYTDRILDHFDGDAALVAGIWPLEIANALRNAERRGRLQPADSVQFAALLINALPITVESMSLDRALGAVLDIARAHGLTSYEASYLERAMREGFPPTTQDDHLSSAAKQVGLALVE